MMFRLCFAQMGALELKEDFLRGQSNDNKLQKLQERIDAFEMQPKKMPLFR